MTLDRLHHVEPIRPRCDEPGCKAPADVHQDGRFRCAPHGLAAVVPLASKRPVEPEAVK